MANPSKPARPDDFGTIHCGGGITIEKPAVVYTVRKDGQYAGHYETLWQAMQRVETIRKSN